MLVPEAIALIAQGIAGLFDARQAVARLDHAPAQFAQQIDEQCRGRSIDRLMLAEEGRDGYARA